MPVNGLELEVKPMSEVVSSDGWNDCRDSLRDWAIFFGEYGCSDDRLCTVGSHRENGATLPKTQVVEGVTIEMPITTAEEKAQRRLEVKDRSTLIMGISNEFQLKFNSIKDAKKLLEAVKKRFGRNAVNTAHGVSTTSTQVNAAYSTNIDNLSDVVSCSFFSSQPNSPQLVHEDLEQIHPDDIEEMDLRCQMAMLTMKAKRFLKKTRRKLTVNGNETIGFDKSNVECYNCHKREHFAKECRAPRNQDNKHKES
nr:hypothetical protein [Tanacetum cinerariifolium]